MSKTKWAVVVLVLGGLIGLPLICYAVKTVKPELEGNIKFSFYGKLIDQNNNPIPSIEIKYNVDVMNLFNARPYLVSNASTVTTNIQGCFSIQRSGVKIVISPIEVSGYEFSHETNPKMMFGYAPPATPDSFVATEANPFIFTLRKKNLPAYLLGIGPTNESSKRIMEDVTNDINASIYIVPPWIDSGGQPGYLPGGEEPQRGQVVRKGDKDLLIEGSLSEDGTHYDLEFSPITPNSGIILSDELLYEAPEAGYQSSIQLSILPGTSELKKYLYIKLDNGKFYGRLDAEFRIDSLDKTPPKARIFIDTWINPSGSRNLEFDEAYQFAERQWRDLLYKLGGYGHFGDYVPTHEEHAAELVEEFGLSSLPDYENEDQFLKELRQLRAKKDRTPPTGGTN